MVEYSIKVRYYKQYIIITNGNSRQSYKLDPDGVYLDFFLDIFPDSGIYKIQYTAEQAAKVTP